MPGRRGDLAPRLLEHPLEALELLLGDELLRLVEHRVQVLVVAWRHDARVRVGNIASLQMLHGMLELLVRRLLTASAPDQQEERKRDRANEVGPA